MFRSGRTTLLGLVLAATALVVVPYATAAQSHLDASSDTGAIANEKSDSQNSSARLAQSTAPEMRDAACSMWWWLFQ